MPAAISRQAGHFKHGWVVGPGSLPAGVVAVISPFNVPIILGIRSVAPALALGNAVLLKPDPRTAVTGGTIMARIFEEAGLPPGVLQMLPGGKDVGGANGKIRDAIGAALKAATKAEERSRSIDFDPADREVGAEARRVTDALERAYDLVRKSGDGVLVLDLNTGAEVKGEAKSAYLAEYADALR